ncbi:hypothetical protein [Microcoleus sp. PH2017_22_RUC_O_B]|uniref:hypothetical protein n=1 Tax=Microcoleus sp. PH2017_22_RUC_O_B TaxID=2798833 RepID=UPI0025DFA988|nr:hypothetical protein [Microcoleus sp. PH2017_22_RUC_O_B]
MLQKAAALKILAAIAAPNSYRAVFRGDRTARRDGFTFKILAKYLQLARINLGGYEADLLDRTNPSHTRP